MKFYDLKIDFPESLLWRLQKILQSQENSPIQSIKNLKVNLFKTVVQIKHKIPIKYSIPYPDNEPWSKTFSRKITQRDPQ